MQPENPRSLRQAIAWMWRYVKVYRKWFWLTVISAVCVVAINIALAFTMRYTLDGAVAGDIKQLLVASGVLILAVGVGAGFSRLRSYAQGVYATAAMRDMRDQLADSISQAQFKQVITWQSGDLASRLNADVDTVERVVKRNFPEFVMQVVMATAAATCVLIIEWRVLVFSLALTPPLMYLANWLNKRAGKHYPDVYKQLGSTTAMAEQSIKGIETLKAFSLGHLFASRQRESYLSVAQAEMRAQLFVSLLQPVCYSLARIPGIVCALYGGYLVANGRFSPGTFMLLFQLYDCISAPTVYAPFALNNINRAVAAIGRISEVLEAEPERTTGDDILEQAMTLAASFENVSFSYDDKPVLRNVSFELQQSQVTALVGSSGSGKSTIANLLCGLYEPEGPGVTLFDRDIRTLALPGIRQQVALVSQDVYLFPGTVLENIRLGRPSAGEDEVIAAAQAAYAHEFIMKLPDGYQTMLGEGGNNLSGGERQRVSIARAILRNAPLVILDEPTSSLDTHSQAVIQRSIENLMQGRTVLIISHRLATVTGAHRILVLDQGRLVESGTHSELIDRQGKYAELYRAQVTANREVAS